MTAHPFWGVATLRDGIDGPYPRAMLPDDGCCPDDRRTSPCALALTMIDLLPSGPLWDRAKEEARARLCDEMRSTCQPACPTPGGPCVSLVDYAIHLGHVLADLVRSLVDPLRDELHPLTARRCLEDWLDRLGWVACQSISCGGPLWLPDSWTRAGACGIEEFCEPGFSDTGLVAWRRAIAFSLWRASFGGVRNLANLNFVIAPLGARIAPDLPYPQSVITWLADRTGPAPCFCDEAALVIRNVAPRVPVVPPEAGDIPTAPAVRTVRCGGVDVQVAPGSAYAACIVAALLPRPCMKRIRVAEVV